MKKKMFYWISLLFTVSIVMGGCIGTSPTPQTEELESVESEIIEEPTAESVVTEEPTEESVVTEEPTEESVATAKPTAKSVATEVPETTSPRTGDIAPDFTLSDGNGTMVNLAEQLQENEQVVLVFYFGVNCPPCMAQLQEIEKDRAKYEAVGTQVIAIAVQGEQGAESSAKVSDAKFPILADSKQSVAKAYGVLDAGLSTPSVFIINKGQQIAWSEIIHIGGFSCGTERVPSQTILENLG